MSNKNIHFGIFLMRLLIIQLFLLSLSFSAITGIDLSGSIDQSGLLDMKIKSNLNNSIEKIVFLNFSGVITDVTIRDKSGLILEPKLVRSGNNTLIYATVPYDYLEYDLRSDSFTTKQGPLWDFDLAIGSSENISSLTGSLSLPKGTILKSTNGAVESGGSLTLSWNASNIDTSHRARFKAGYQLEELNEPMPFLIGGGAVLIILIFILLIRRPKAQLRSSNIQPDYPPKINRLENNSVFKTLDETDKEIIREILNQNGKTTQAHLYLHTHVPKATLSRRIVSLTNKGVLTKSQKGNRNLISLTDIFDR